MKILVVGMGYVGTITAYALAKQGVDVLCLEKDSEKLELLEKGKMPFYEPGLDVLIKEAKSRVNILHRVEDLDFGNIDFIFICVGTPLGSNGMLNLTAVFDSVEKISRISSFQANINCSIIIRSTIEGNTIDKLEKRLRLRNVYNEILFHPEFLREGSAISDFFNPPFITCSIPRRLEVQESFEKLYSGIGDVIFESSSDLELLKLACNTWHALKVTFANEVGRIAHHVGADGLRVMNMFVKDDKLNISSAYLKPGFAYGGSCLPKDTSSLSKIANVLGLGLIPSLNPANESIIDSFVTSIINSGETRINWIGITFKENTDDTRDSPYLKALRKILIEDSIEITLFDPTFGDSSKGRNRDIWLELMGYSNLKMVNSINSMNRSTVTYKAHNYNNLKLEEHFNNVRVIE